MAGAGGAISTPTNLRVVSASPGLFGSSDPRRVLHLAVSCATDFPLAQPFPATLGITEIQANPFSGKGNAIDGGGLEEGLIQQQAQ